MQYDKHSAAYDKARRTIDHCEKSRIRELFLGRKIIAVDNAELTLTLDNGAVIRVDPNEGCGGCSSGSYGVDGLNSFDEVVITNVETTCDDNGDETVYKIFAIGASGIKREVVSVSGDDGNGYYCTGFCLYVTAPEEMA